MFGGGSSVTRGTRVGIFGDLDTPVAKKPEPTAKQLVELSIRPHAQHYLDENKQIAVTVVQALFDPPTQTILLRAEAKTAFSDGTTGGGVTVAFFLNGKRLYDIATDEFGIAHLEQSTPANLFTRSYLTDELTARIVGHAKESSIKVETISKEVRLKASFRWKIARSLPRPSSPQAQYTRYEQLHIEITTYTLPSGFPFSVEGQKVVVERYEKDFNRQWETLATGMLDSRGQCHIILDKYYYDGEEMMKLAKDDFWERPENYARLPLCNLEWGRYDSGTGEQRGLRVRLEGWRSYDTIYGLHGISS